MTLESATPEPVAGSVARGPNPPVAIQRCDRFVARTMNWMYDHLRFVHPHLPFIVADQIENRREFPDLEAIPYSRHTLLERAWGRLVPSRAFPSLASALRHKDPAVLHSHFGYVAVNDGVLHRALRVPWVVGFYGADVYLLGRKPAWRDRYQALFEKIRMALVLGPVMAAAVRDLGCPADKIVVHPLGVDAEGIEFVERDYVAGGPVELLFAGTFREKKGLEYLIEAAGILHRRGLPFRLHLVGDTAGRAEDTVTRDRIWGAIDRFSIRDQVTSYSWLEFKELLDLARRCHIFVAPSVTAADGDAEGTPFVIQQLMLTGMPVVSTRHSDIPFLYGPHAAALAPERDAVALADRIQSYAESPDSMRRDGILLRDRMREAFDVRVCAGRLGEHYLAAASASR